MNNYEIANRLREIADRQEKALGVSKSILDIRQVADELDPPRPKPGTVVWWRHDRDYEYHAGLIGIKGDSVTDYDGRSFSLRDADWKPARILADDEVAVKILPVQDWPRRCDEISLRWNYHPIDKNMQAYAGVTITRAEAEEREAGR